MKKNKTLIALVAVIFSCYYIHKVNFGTQITGAQNNSLEIVGVSDVNKDTITTTEDFQRVITDSVHNLDDKLEMNIKNYNKTKFNLDDINISEVRMSGQYTTYGNKTKMMLTFKYRGNHKLLRAVEDEALVAKLSKEEKEVYDKALSIVDEIVPKDGSEYEKEKAIHDYLVLNNKYDYDNVLADTVPDESYQITGLLTNNIGVCNAYAYAFQMLCQMASLDTQIIVGELEGKAHAWNLIKIDDEYYHVDVTSDDPVFDREGEVQYSYFNLSDDQIRKSHSFSDDYPVATGKAYNYYVYNGLVVTDNSSLNELIGDKLGDGVNEIRFCSDGYIIENLNIFENVAREYGYSYIELLGEPGRDGAFVVSFSK